MRLFRLLQMFSDSDGREGGEEGMDVGVSFRGSGGGELLFVGKQVG